MGNKVQMYKNSASMLIIVVVILMAFSANLCPLRQLLYGYTYYYTVLCLTFSLCMSFEVGGNRSTRRKPTQTRGEHAARLHKGPCSDPNLPHLHVRYGKNNAAGPRPHAEHIYLFIWNYTFETVAHDVCKYRCIHQNNF